MPKQIIPTNDPTRLERMQNEKLRMIGVDTSALAAQVQAKQEAQKRERELDAAAAAAANRAETGILQLAAARSLAQLGINQAISAYRQEQEAERRLREQHARHEEEEGAAAELAANRASPWLNEAPQLAASALAPHRVRPDHFKAFSPQQNAAILATRAEQAEAKRLAGQRTAAEEAAAAARTAAEAAEVERRAALAAAQRSHVAREVSAVQQLQAAEARQREAQNNASSSSQQPSPAYFAQWGTSHR